MKGERYIVFVLIMVWAGIASAVPAYRGPIVRTSEDGTEQVVYMHGDEDFHYLTDRDGRWLHAKTLMPMSEEEKRNLENGIQKAKAARRIQAQTEGIGDEPNPAPRGLLLLVQFQDVKFTTPKDTLDSLLNGAHFARSYEFDYQYAGETYHYSIQAEGSARKYFQDQSYGAYNPHFDVLGPLTLSKEMAYYGKDETDGSGYTTHDVNRKEFVREVCQIADNAGANFANYDFDGDGIVDFIYIIYAGFGEADGGGDNTIWPHQWNVVYYDYEHDGKTIGRYACSNELNYISKVYDGIGTFCHEFSHVLGLPDLYETNYSRTGVHTLFEWDVMDNGAYNNDGNTPPAYSAYERFYMGWLTPRLLNEPENVTLQPINQGEGESLLISTANTHNLCGWNPNPKEFYLLEARKREGWDYHLPGYGLMITKISYSPTTWKNNTVNNNARSMGVDIQEALANSDLYAKKTDVFPAMISIRSWKGYEGHEVTNIRKSGNGNITFNYRGGEQDIKTVSGERLTVSGKILRDGQIVIVRNGKEYDVLGRLMN